MKTSVLFATASLLAATVSVSWAGVIPYPDPGTVAPQVVTYASSSKGINIYYYGSTANYTDYVQVLDVQTGYNSGSILDNHNTAPATEVTVGATPGEINKGDQLVFYIASPEGLFASIASYSADGVNHAYITDFGGGNLYGTAIPSGLFVGLEDESSFHSDFNYNDDTFIFTGVSAPSVGTGVTPEPGSLALFGTGLLSLGGILRRRVGMGTRA